VSIRSRIERLTMQQLEEIRALCDKPFKKPAIREEETGV
jgi:hypothetical protein